MRDLDSAIFRMEKDIDELGALLREKDDQIRRLQTQSLLRSNDEFSTMITGGLMACIGQPDLNAMTPAAVTMLVRIRNMKTIDEVHAYVDEFIDKNKKQLIQQEQ